MTYHFLIEFSSFWQRFHFLNAKIFPCDKLVRFPVDPIIPLQVFWSAFPSFFTHSTLLPLVFQADSSLECSLLDFGFLFFIVSSFFFFFILLSLNFIATCCTYLYFSIPCNVKANCTVISITRRLSHQYFLSYVVCNTDNQIRNNAFSWILRLIFLGISHFLYSKMLFLHLILMKL